ncbi:MAG TPA: RedB protein, partial [Blastocatellia bacterium]|nr:RedB protein [Blastocatellia bacterium]
MIKQNLKWIVLGMMWAGAISAGMSVLWGYEAKAGKAADAPVQWPIKSNLERPTNRALLLVAIHPHCPCSRAAIGELSRLMTRHAGHVRAQVLFVKPIGVPIDWEKTDLWQSASVIPGVQVKCDPNGEEAALFNAATSGQTMLYGKDGKLLFSGGITAARGHFG